MKAILFSTCKLFFLNLSNIEDVFRSANNEKRSSYL